MKYLFLISVFFVYSMKVFSQNQKGNKPILDCNAIDNWEEIGYDGDVSISDDGKYFAYTIEKKSTQMRQRLVVQSTSNSWRKEFPTASIGFFSIDSKQYIFQEKDSFCIVRLDNGDCTCEKDLDSFKKTEIGGSDLAWNYKSEMEKGVKWLSNKITGIDSAIVIQQASFTDNGRYIMLTLTQQPILIQPKPSSVKLDVWNYQDTTLQQSQLYQLKQPKKFMALFYPGDSRVVILENEHEKLKAVKSEFAVVGKIGNEVNGDRFWEASYSVDSNYLVSLKDGSRKLLKTRAIGNVAFWFSPQGKYLLYFDPQQQCNYFSYNLQTGKQVKISSGVPAWQLGFHDFYKLSQEKPNKARGVIGWLEEDAGFLVYDGYDIWLLDVTGKKSPVNITNGYGRLHQIRFDLDDGFGVSHLANSIFKSNQTLLLKAFDEKKKYNGFFRKRLGEVGDPELLYMGPCVISGNIAGISGMKPLKAKNADVWIVKRQSAIEAPNYFVTSDFKNYSRLTDFQPQNKYNWLTSELHEFKHLDGKKGQGILYKPENFDPTKKYPVLIIFYRDYSNRLYQFPSPIYNWSAITPAESPILFLNSGYLVFTPDIYVSPLKYGPSAFNVVEGATRYLRQFPYVDSKKIGAAAHSWSAKLGTYIFTHSHTLTAMAISEGLVYANLINTALSIGENSGESNLKTIEKDFEFGNLWKNKSNWLDQTAVFNVNKATSPLLLYCNKKSLKDYQNQTIQLFTALRRLEKPVWWLSYDNAGHTLEGDDTRDYTIRYMQFFNHYLRSAPPPIWMSRGIPARLKQIETGYAYDPSGNCGKDCKVCKQWNDKMKKDSAATWIEIEKRKVEEHWQ